MRAEFWYLILGGLFVLVTLTGTLTRRLPVTVTIMYLAAGLALGPVGFGVAVLDAVNQSALLERLSELAVIVSLFTAGLKLRPPLSSARWRVPIRLAFVAMVLTVGLVTVAGTQLLGLGLGAAVLLGAVLAPTDPVLASDVQLKSAADQDKLRFGITGEAGLNDGTAFPFVMLGLGLLGLHELGGGGWRWVAVDLVWAVGGGLGIGTLLGTAAGSLVLYLRRVHKEGTGRDELLAMGLIGVSYGAALAVETYGFLAVFAAGLALRSIERRHSGEKPPEQLKDLAAAGKAIEVSTDPEKAPAYMAEAVLVSNERAERLLEAGMVLLVGLMFRMDYLSWSNVLFAALLFLLLRPIAVFAGLIGTGARNRERLLLGWFGIRGIGSLYYLMYAIGQGVTGREAEALVGTTLTVVVLSILAHGMSVSPLMQLYRRGKREHQPGSNSPS